MEGFIFLKSGWWLAEKWEENIFQLKSLSGDSNVTPS